MELFGVIFSSLSSPVTVSESRAAHLCRVEAGSDCIPRSEVPRDHLWSPPGGARRHQAPARPFPPRGPYLNALKNMLEGPGDDASLGGRVQQALHGEGLPAARLAVGKDGAVVALSDTLQGRTRTPALSSAGPAQLGLGPGPGPGLRGCLLTHTLRLPPGLPSGVPGLGVDRQRRIRHSCVLKECTVCLGRRLSQTVVKSLCLRA